MAQFTTIQSIAAPLLSNDIDTDQIIPARFLKVTDKTGIGRHLFSDWRYHDDGSPKEDFILNKPEYAGSKILLAGNNFGCGSSREHAPWALCGFGFRAVISTKFADIFKNNSLKNGLLPVEISFENHFKITEAVRKNPQIMVTIDLPSQSVVLPDGEKFTFPIDAFSKTCLLNGVDELGYILRFEESIIQFERKEK